jgi:hypothetical protein
MTFTWTFPRPRRHRPSRPWSPLTDAEWHALRPYIDHPGAGRPLADPRARMDAIFQAVTTRGLRWSHYAPPHGKADTLHRHFRRLAHAGAWTALLKRVAARRCPKPLRALRDWICAAHRRATRILGLAAIVLARRLRLHRALPGPCWMLPDPDLSETLREMQIKLLSRRDDPAWLGRSDDAARPNRRGRPARLRGRDNPDLPAMLRLVARVLARIGRRRSIPRCLEPR